ncbi:MAG: tripartite AtP-independent periplasmic transporter subunit DctQ [Candidatus Frackibacter sp. T328-2]|nr:MAG: tripartite AtP-independent periplasmic transporter subunit DctQ [Candidatus Frackibacter sp. T328-2]
MGFLKKFNSILRKVEETVVAYGILAMALSTIINVIARSIFNNSLSFTQELNQFLIIFVTFFGTSYAARNGRHIRMSAIYDSIGAKGKKIMLYIMHPITSLIIFYLTYLSAKYVLKVYKLGRTSSVMEVPLYLIWIWVPIGFFFTAVQYGLAFIRNIKEDEPWSSFEEKADYEEVEVESDDQLDIEYDEVESKE